MATVEEPIEAQQLMKSAHETADLQSIVAAYAAMEVKGESQLPPLAILRRLILCLLLSVLETELWVQKHVRPDGTVFILDEPEAAAFGKGQDVGFNWGVGPITVRSLLAYQRWIEVLMLHP